MGICLYITEKYINRSVWNWKHLWIGIEIELRAWGIGVQVAHPNNFVDRSGEYLSNAIAHSL